MELNSRKSFRHSCRSSCITHVHAQPYNPQSNGQAERFVDTFKHALPKAKGEGTTIEEMLQDTTPFVSDNTKWRNKE